MLMAPFSMFSTIVGTMIVNLKWHGYNGKAEVKAGETYRILLHLNNSQFDNLYLMGNN